MRGPTGVVKDEDTAEVEDVNLTSAELMAASKSLIEFLKDWEQGLYAAMARRVHLPKQLHVTKTQVLQRQFEPNPLLAFEEDINVVKAAGDWHQETSPTKRIRIGYVDFAVVVICGDERGMSRGGVFIRLVLVDDQWLVNPHSMNRRFHPKMADEVKAEAEAIEKEEDNTDGEEKEGQQGKD